MPPEWPTVEIVVIAIRAYKESLSSCEEDNQENVVHIRMTPTEHLLVEASIRAWIPYLKKETSERPFQEMTLTL